MESIKRARARLPIYKARDEIIEAVQQDKTIIFMGETGCGKTTQIPQYLLEAGYAKFKAIAITQPRRVAAVSLADRVAQEVQTQLGNLVGYSIRFDKCVSGATKIKFLTDGMLLRETADSPLLLEYSVVILDEVHERTLNNDILMGICKTAQRVREERNLMPLKIIVMSATIDDVAEHISKYFDNAPRYTIIGRDYAIEILYPSQPQKDMLKSVFITVFQIHQKEDDGDILVFATGQEEIDKLVSETNEQSNYLPIGVGRIKAFAFYAALPKDQQDEVFRPTPMGTRKVIYATNIAETSITIPNIKYVVDTGRVKTKIFDAGCGFDVLKTQAVSKAQADQRAGRAGRDFDGSCYRLYTKEQHLKFRDQTVPEIQRSCLSTVILQMVAAGISNVAEFDFIDKPPKDIMDASILTLKQLDAIIDKDGDFELTEDGKKMVLFPMDPRLSKIILTSAKYKCSIEILTIISMLSVGSWFYSNTSERETFNEVKKKFHTVEGDHIMLLNLFRQFKKYKGNQSWCKENYINARSMKKVIQTRNQLKQISIAVGIPWSTSSCTMKIRKCLASGLFMCAALQHEKNTYKTVEGNRVVKIHPSSCLYKTTNLSCVIYNELLLTSDVFMRYVSYIPEEVLVSVNPKYFKEKPCRLSITKPEMRRYR